MENKSTRSLYFLCAFPQRRTRDGWSFEEPLAHSANDVAARVNDAYLKDIEFSLYGASPHASAADSIRLLRPDATIHYFEGLGPGDLEPWKRILGPPVPTAGPKALYGLADPLGENLLRLRGKSFWGTATRYFRDSLKPGGNALICSHSPLIELGIAAFIHLWPPEDSLNPGDILRIDFLDPEGENAYRDYHLVSAIR